MSTLTYILVSACSVALVVFSLAVTRGKITPMVMHSMYWATALVAPLVLADFAVHAAALWFIVAVIFAFAMGAFTGRLGRRAALPLARSLYRVRATRPPILFGMTWGGALASLLAAVLVVASRGASLGSLLSVQGVLDSGSDVAISLLQEGQGVPTLAVVLVTLTYVAAITAPFAARAASTRLHAYALLAAPTVAAVVFGMVTTKRFGLLLTAVLTGSAVVARQLMEQGQLGAVTWRRLAKPLAAVLTLGMLFVAFAFVRIGRLDADASLAVERKVEVYAFGYLPAFSEWFSQYYLHEYQSLDWGMATTSGITNVFALDRRERGYAAPVEIGDNAARTNIFTGLRPLVEDFGVVGALIVIWALGFVLERTFLRLRRKVSWHGGVVVAVWLSFLLLSVTQSIFIFTNVVFGIALGWSLVYISGSIGPSGPLQEPLPDTESWSSIVRLQT